MLEDADRSKVVTGTVGKPLTEGNLLIITKHAPLGLHNCTSNTQDAFVTLSGMLCAFVNVLSALPISRSIFQMPAKQQLY